MSSSFGRNIRYTLFGESHGAAIGITIEGLPSGFSIDFNQVDQVLTLRSGGAIYNTPRNEKNNYEMLTGYFNNKLTGTPFTVIFPNHDVQSQDYDKIASQPRPSHTDYVAGIKYHNHHDYRGGGHFSGRLTTPLVFLGAIIKQLFAEVQPDLAVHSHIKQLGTVHDKKAYYQLRNDCVKNTFNIGTDGIDASFLIDTLENDDCFTAFDDGLATIKNTFADLDAHFPVIDDASSEKMQALITQALATNDSLGGSIETVIFAPPLALGAPFFHSVESIISSLLLSIGSIKGVAFGYGTAFADKLGSEVKDEIIRIVDGKIQTLHNFNGGINGGITNGEDVVITSTFKPISSIKQTQHTLNMTTNKIEPLTITGRHDVTIANRLIPVIEAVILIALYDLYLDERSNIDDRL